MAATTVFMASHAKAVTAAAVGVAAAVSAALSGGEIVTIAVTVMTIGGAAFGSTMSARAKRYEIDLSHEESEISRLRDDIRTIRDDLARMRERVDVVDDMNRELEKENVRLWVAARIIEGQLLELDVEPATQLERPKAAQ